MSGKLCETALYGLLKNNTVMNSPIEFHNRSNKLAVIIDPRFDDIMEAVIRNFMYYMNPEGWNILIISWSGHRKTINDKFPNSLFGEIDNNLIYKDTNGNPNITVDTYNKILMSVEFWQSLPADHVVIFQKDCIMFKMFPDYFRLYDFCGANWYTQNNTMFNDGINGGFSIRNRNTMIECLQKISFDMIEQYRRDALTNSSIIFKTMSDNQRGFLQTELSKKKRGCILLVCMRIVTQNDAGFTT